MKTASLKGNKKQAHLSFRKKDTIIRNIEIIVACIVAFIVGWGVYGVL